MNAYVKTVWENDETQLNEDNMNKIENQLENITNEIISEEAKNYVTPASLNTTLGNYATQTYVTNAINSAIGDALGGSY